MYMGLNPAGIRGDKNPRMHRESYPLLALTQTFQLKLENLRELGFKGEKGRIIVKGENVSSLSV
jgi:hypothetical protein